MYRGMFGGLWPYLPLVMNGIFGIASRIALVEGERTDSPEPGSHEGYECCSECN
jgi:hypothetical protein